MSAETLNCPMCGAPASSDATRCEHCGARLATVACPSCFGLIFQGAKFCSHCGAKVDRTEVDAKAAEKCPRCRVEMEAVQVGNTHLRECPQCEGIWADADSLQQICADREEQAAVLGMPTMLQAGSAVDLEANIRYVPCPVCAKLMNRVNFARCSGVVVDVCRAHGTWFDRDELRRIVEFIRAGGFEKERLREIDELQQQRRQLESARRDLSADANAREAGLGYSDRHLGISLVGSVLQSLFR
jgi:Zn-finger nucleic acid-binding protein